MAKSDKEKIRKVEQDANERAKPSPEQMITITPSSLITKTTPLWMRSVQANAMIEEADRYQGCVDKNKDQELCIGVVPLEDGDRFPVLMARILDTDGITHTEAKPCANSSLKSSPYCSSCKKALNAG